jgi:hypothetical protein
MVSELNCKDVNTQQRKMLPKYSLLWTIYTFSNVFLFESTLLDYCTLPIRINKLSKKTHIGGLYQTQNKVQPKC